jgi:hypothetical protein
MRQCTADGIDHPLEREQRDLSFARSWSAAAPERASSQATFQALLAQSDLAVAAGQIGCRYVKVLTAAVRSLLKFAHSR